MAKRLKSIIFGFDFVISSGMRANGTNFGSGVGIYDVAAVTAFPGEFSVSYEYAAVFDVRK